MTSRSNCQTKPSILTMRFNWSGKDMEYIRYYSTIILWASPFALSGIIRNYDEEFPSKIARTLFHPNNISYVGRMIIRPSNKAGPSIFMLDVFRTADHAGHIFIPHLCAMINLSYQYNTDIQTILTSFSFPGTPYTRVPIQKSPALPYWAPNLGPIRERSCPNC